MQNDVDVCGHLCVLNILQHFILNKNKTASTVEHRSVCIGCKMLQSNKTNVYKTVTLPAKMLITSNIKLGKTFYQVKQITRLYKCLAKHF